MNYDEIDNKTHFQLLQLCSLSVQPSSSQRNKATVIQKKGCFIRQTAFALTGNLLSFTINANCYYSVYAQCTRRHAKGRVERKGIRQLPPILAGSINVALPRDGIDVHLADGTPKAVDSLVQWHWLRLGGRCFQPFVVEQLRQLLPFLFEFLLHPLFGHQTQFSLWELRGHIARVEPA